MRLMQEDAMEKIHAGLTTLDEILRVVPIENAAHPECPKCSERILPMFKYCPHCGTKNAVQAPPSRSHSRHSMHEEVLHT